MSQFWGFYQCWCTAGTHKTHHCRERAFKADFWIHTVHKINSSRELNVPLTVYCMGSTYLRLFHSFLSPFPRCSAFHSSASLSLLPLKDKNRTCYIPLAWSVFALFVCFFVTYLYPRCICTGCLWSCIHPHNSGPGAAKGAERSNSSIEKLKALSKEHHDCKHMHYSVNGILIYSELNTSPD